MCWTTTPTRSRSLRTCLCCRWGMATLAPSGCHLVARPPGRSKACHSNAHRCSAFAASCMAYNINRWTPRLVESASLMHNQINCCISPLSTPRTLRQRCTSCQVVPKELELISRCVVAAGVYYTASEEDIRLFPTQSHQLIAIPTTTGLGARLAVIAGTGKMNIKRLSPGDLVAELLLQTLPPGWR